MSQVNNPETIGVLTYLSTMWKAVKNKEVKYWLHAYVNIFLLKCTLFVRIKNDVPVNSPST